jgi:hypothetical protein
MTNAGISWTKDRYFKSYIPQVVRKAGFYLRRLGFYPRLFHFEILNERSGIGVV